jgi:methylglutaconyl-CoA hydratase
MSHDRVLQDLRDGVLRLTLNRADKRNALDAATIDALHAGLDRADLDADVRVIVVQGAGKDFCAGADLAELLASADRTAADNEAHAMHLGRVFLRMRALPKPVVAVVHGRALAGGCGLASACDLVVAHADATFGVFSEGEFTTGTDALVAQLSASSPTAMALIKRQLYELDGRDFSDGVELGARVNATARSTDDFKEAVQRFLDKR